MPYFVPLSMHATLQRLESNLVAKVNGEDIILARAGDWIRLDWLRNLGQFRILTNEEVEEGFHELPPDWQPEPEPTPMPTRSINTKRRRLA